jgi:hypothetical protein
MDNAADFSTKYLVTPRSLVKFLDWNWIGLKRKPTSTATAERNHENGPRVLVIAPLYDIAEPSCAM